jgi:hypothetical protein
MNLEMLGQSTRFGWLIPAENWQPAIFFICVGLLACIETARSFSDEHRVTYEWRVEGGRSEITYTMPYLKRIERNEIVPAQSMRNLAPAFPRLSAQVSNRSRGSVFLTKVTISVIESSPDERPIIYVFETSSEARVSFGNQGWAEIRSAELTILGWAKYENADCMKAKFSRAEPATISDFKILDTDIYFYIDSAIPLSLRANDAACIEGTLKYEWGSDRRGILNFRSFISLKSVPSGPLGYRPPTAVYDLFLPCGESGYQKVIPISQTIAGKSEDHFLIKIWSDKSCRFVFDAVIATAERESIPAGTLALTIFVPRWYSMWTDLAPTLTMSDPVPTPPSSRKEPAPVAKWRVPDAIPEKY